MAEPFVSLNSWFSPGCLYQASEPFGHIAGSRAEWPRLRELLQRHRGAAPDTRAPGGAAVGYFTYEGDFEFHLFHELEVVSPEITNRRWKERLDRRPHLAAGPWRAGQTRAQFEEGVRRAQEYIAAGDIYQVNLAQRFEADFGGDPYRLFEQLLWRSPAPGGAFLDLGPRQILSSSPELFLKVQGRQVVTSPIKGTRPRSRDLLRDRQLAYELQTDPKELAELVMITDLERNDLGQVCEFGSVTVSDLAKLEQFAQVYHLVSTVEGVLRPGLDAFDALTACFPGGSISGAPKKRACEIIAELEPVPRGIYTGAIGYFAFNGDAAFSIAIRTLIHEAGRLHFHVGSGITAGSIPAFEYEETLHKAAGLQLAVAEYGKLAAAPAPASA